MPSTFLGINIGASGLAASQLGQDVTGNNISNANTPGYSVESANFQANGPLSAPDSIAGSLPNGQIGTGVSVNSITRAQDQYLSNQLRAGNGTLGLQTAQSDALQQIENAYGEPSDNGLNAALTSFFQGFNNVANNPEDLGVRSTAIQNGVTLTNAFQSIGAQLDGVGAQLSQKAASDVQTINSYGTQIAALNATIRASNVAGQQPNDLLDQRDQLLDKLSSLANINVLNNSDGTVNVSIATTDLVVGVDANAVTVAGLQARGDLQSGDLAGVAQAQTSLQNNRTALNNLAAAVAAQVNSVHSAGAGLDGSTGLNFFSVTSGNEAATISVNPALLSDPSKLAAAQAPATPGAAPAPGDAAVATQLANLQNLSLTSGPLAGKTLIGYYQETVTDAGAQAATAQTAQSSAQASVTQLSNQRDSITGVSTDTELTNMMRYQRAYQASARFVQTQDDMLNTLITGLFSS
ncbi:MAG: flagellar hook-associated protein FlgK [Armatimonadetes bacterium]|nr:flagellar hook-associated protein FlgK [Armatimonadota bacterium]